MRFVLWWTVCVFVYCLFCAGTLVVHWQWEEEMASKIFLEYPQDSFSTADLHSVTVAGQQLMTYCSLIARTNLQRFTQLPLTKNFWEPWAVLQWDAIALIEWGLASDTFFPVWDNVAYAMPFLFGDIPSYSLFDLYIYTPHEDDSLTQTDYLFQWHRVVLLFVDWFWRVLDPLKWSWTTTRQPRSSYQRVLDPTAYLFVYAHLYTFHEQYEKTMPLFLWPMTKISPLPDKKLFFGKETISDLLAFPKDEKNLRLF